MLPRILRVAMAVGLWTVLVLALVSARLVAMPDLIPRWHRVLLAQTTSHFVWLALAPALWWLVGAVGRRPGFERAMLVALGVLAATVIEATYTFAVAPPRGIGLLEWWAARGDRAVYLGLAVAAARLAADRFARLRAEAALQGEEEVLLRRAELLHLDRQLQPHFLFNALNAIAELVHGPATAARTAIGHLGSLFGRLSKPPSSRATVRDEIEAVESYLALQRIRFGDRLHVAYDIEPEAASAWVPTFILQPLVENAVRHGIEPSSAGGAITISSGFDGRWLVLAVADRGRVLPRSSTVGRGIGLANVRRRLSCCYGPAARCELTRDESGGATATIRIPRGTPLAELDATVEGERTGSARAAASPAEGGSGGPAVTITAAPGNWHRPAWILSRMAAGWIGIGVVWVGWAWVAAIAAGTTVDSVLGAETVARELGLYLLASGLAVGLASIPASFGWPPRAFVAAQVTVGSLALFAVAAAVGWWHPTHQARLIAWEASQTRITGFLMALLVASAWAWQVHSTRATSAAVDARARRLALESASRRWHVQPAVVHDALTAIAATAESDPDRADAIVVHLADVLRRGLAAIRAEQAQSDPIPPGEPEVVYG